MTNDFAFTRLPSIEKDIALPKKNFFLQNIPKKLKTVVIKEPDNIIFLNLRLQSESP